MVPFCRIIYGEEFPEWRMEKHRFYCELPGDIWDDGYFMSLVRPFSALKMLSASAFKIEFKGAAPRWHQG